MKNLNDVISEVRDIASTITHTEIPEIDEKYKWPEKTMKALMEAGLGGLVVPKKDGGHGFGMLAVARACEELGRVNASAALCFGMHCVGTASIASKATEYQREHYLKPIAQGKHITTLAVSEPGTGAHFYFPQTQLLVDKDKTLKINGDKTFVTNGNHADSYVISTMAADPDAPPERFSCVVLPNNAEGISWGPEWTGLGMRGNSSRSMHLKNVQISYENLLGEEGDQLWYVFNVLAPYFLIAMSGTYLGISMGAIEEATSHIKKRVYQHSGTALSGNEIVQNQLGQLWSVAESTRRLIYHAATSGDKGEADAITAILASKAEVGRCVTQTVNEAMTMVGGIGYRENSNMDRMLRDARAAHVMAPTTNQLYTWIGRALLDQPILGE